MSFSRYSIEKKQVSTDRGVHWEDVTPGETRKGNLVGVARTLIECEDMACELQKTEYTVIAGFLPDEICGDIFKTLPSGIAKMVTWTSGAICCSSWQQANPHTTDRYGTVRSHTIGTPYCIKDGISTTVCPSFTYSSTTVNGRELDNLCFDVEGHYGWDCPETLCACFRITSFMPWAEGKERWSLIQAQDYKREHCSDAWELDGDPYIVGIGERWIFVDENFNDERWVHQIAKTFDDNGNVVEWQSDNTYVYRHMTETELDPSIELLDYVINDGVICCAGNGCPAVRGYMQIAKDTSYELSGYAMVCRGYTEGSDAFYVGTNSGGTSYIKGIHSWGAGYNWDDIAMTLTDKLSTYRMYSALPDRVYFRSLFCGVNLSYSQSSRMYYISGVNNILSGTRSGKITNYDGETVAFPCRIHENLGQTDDYWNSSKIGYVLRNGDGTMVVMETLKLEDGQLVKEHPEWTTYH